MVDEVKEVAETTVSPEEELGSIEKIAMAHLLDKRLRTGEKAYSGAMFHIHLANLIIDRLEQGPSALRELNEMMESFWNRHYQRILEHYQEAVAKPGRLYIPEKYREKEVKKAINKVVMGPEKRGVRGLVATAFMARKNGWRLKFPSVEEDVKKAIDLTILKGALAVPLQIKCHQSQESLVVSRKGSRVWVGVPARRDFYVDPMIGIPRSEHVRNFGELLDGLLKNGG